MTDDYYFLMAETAARTRLTTVCFGNLAAWWNREQENVAEQSEESEEHDCDATRRDKEKQEPMRRSKQMQTDKSAIKGQE